jgi:seryl-tRNA synthetase
MFTTRYVKDNIEAIRESLERRKSNYPVDKLLALDSESAGIRQELQELRTERNAGSRKLSEAKKSGGEADVALSKRLLEVKARIIELESSLERYDSNINSLLLNMPNILDRAVPYGADESGNVELKKVGEAKKRMIPGHEEILKNLGLLELEKAAEVSGARFYYLKGDGALLEQALIRFAIGNITKSGYTLISPPMMLRKEYYKGVTALGDFEEALYKVVDPLESDAKEGLEKLEDELFLISTSEHAIAAMHSGKVFSAKELPRKYVGISPCFRREAGAHGKDSKGIFRVHQFYKVEQFAFSRAEDSPRLFGELMGNSEKIFAELGLPYRIIEICTGDIGSVAARKQDLEAYMPAQDKYREMVSCSNCTDWQALRLNIRYDEGNDRKYVHTLNSTALAVSRTIVAIVENYYNESDGSIEIPDALVDYMGKSRIVG